jgi:putative transposase
MEGHRLGEATPTEAIHPMAKLLGTELDQLQVKEANRKQRELKRATLRMAKELDCDLGESGLAELPWMKGQKRPLALVHKAAPQPEQPAMSAEEKARLTAVAQEAKAAREAAPAYSAPEFFASPLERYEFLFGISVRQGLELTEEDAAFMRSFEASREWEYCRGRFEQLRALYAARHNQQEVAG